jgi:exodeoxyribonuclease VII small subunit
VLTRHAQTLREQEEPNIDDLLKIVTESVEAYKVCKTRIDAVEQALEQALGAAEKDGPSKTPPARAGKPAARSLPAEPLEDDGDVPF